MIIGLIGYAQTGKDSLSEVLVSKYNFKRIAFADKIRELLYEMDPPVPIGVSSELHVVGLQNYVDIFGWDEAKQHHVVRSMLQNLGVGARKLFHKEFWIMQAFYNLEPKDQNYVITDVRFTNEADIIKRMGGTIWRITRPGVGAVNSHISETELDSYQEDLTIVNEGSLEELELLVQQRMEEAIAHQTS